jgi:ZIP family zinc transporter
MVFLIGIAAFISTFLGGLFALRLRDRLHLILGFSAGAVIGVAFFDLMPEAFSLIGSTHTPFFVTSVIAIGFGLYLVLDRMIVLHRDHHEHTSTDTQSAGHGSWLAGTFSIHSFLDGLGIGLAFHISPTIGLVVAAAVLTHDFSDGINTVNVVLKSSATRIQALRWLLIDAIAPMVGIFVTIFFSVSDAILGILIALFSGFFLYIGTSDLLPESHHDHPVRWTTFATILGMMVMYLVVHFAM